MNLQPTTATVTIQDDGYPWHAKPVELISLPGLPIDSGPLFRTQTTPERWLVLPRGMIDLLGEDAALRLLTGFTRAQVDDLLQSTPMTIRILHDAEDAPEVAVVYRWEVTDPHLPAGITYGLWAQRIPATWFGLHPDSPPVPGGMVVPAATLGSGAVYGCGGICRACYAVTDTQRDEESVDAAMRQILERAALPTSETILASIADLAAWAGGITTEREAYHAPTHD